MYICIYVCIYIYIYICICIYIYTTYTNTDIPTVIYSQLYIRNGHTPAPPPYQTRSTNLGTTDNIMEHQDML